MSEVTSRAQNKMKLMNDIVSRMMDDIVEETNCMQSDEKYDEMIQLTRIQCKLKANC